MKLLKKLFKSNKKQFKTDYDIYEYMGSIGVSPRYMLMYENSINIIKNYENKAHCEENNIGIRCTVDT